MGERNKGFPTVGCSSKASQMHMDPVSSVGTGKQWVPVTLKFPNSEVDAEHRELRPLAVTEEDVLSRLNNI